MTTHPEHTMPEAQEEGEKDKGKTLSVIKAIVSNFLLLSLALFLGLIIFGIWQLKDRHPDILFELSSIKSKGEIKAGFAALPINPKYYDSWIDQNQDAKFEEGVDLYMDLNDNDQFDAIWMAGFHANRPIQSIHDTLLASAMVLEVGKKSIGLLSLDVIGLGNDQCWEIRKRVQSKTGIDHIYIIATHNHEGPDVIGLWGNSKYKSAVNPEYLEYLIDQSVLSLSLAYQSRQLARITIATDSSSAIGMLQDTRPPFVIDPSVNILQARSIVDDQVLGTLVNWSNHVETLWDQNLGMSADFVHYLRKGISEGIGDGENTMVPKQGGVTIFVPGSIGGLMTTSPELSVRDPLTNSFHTKPSFEKAQAQGYALAKIVYETLAADHHPTFFHTSLQSYQQPIELPLENVNFRLGAYLGIIDRGMTGWMKVRSEIGFWQLGPASFVHVPGELYPEIVIGGIEEPTNADLPNEALEVPPIKNVMPGDYRWIVGMSNDMIGYIVPRSQWDEKAPFTYAQEKAPYGEIMSLGPQTAPKIHAALLSLMSQAEVE